MRNQLPRSQVDPSRRQPVDRAPLALGRPPAPARAGDDRARRRPVRRRQILVQRRRLGRAAPLGKAGTLSTRTLRSSATVTTSPGRTGRLAASMRAPLTRTWPAAASAAAADARAHHARVPQPFVDALAVQVSALGALSARRSLLASSCSFSASSLANGEFGSGSLPRRSWLELQVRDGRLSSRRSRRARRGRAGRCGRLGALRPLGPARAAPAWPVARPLLAAFALAVGTRPWRSRWRGRPRRSRCSRSGPATARVRRARGARQPARPRRRCLARGLAFGPRAGRSCGRRRPRRSPSRGAALAGRTAGPPDFDHLRLGRGRLRGSAGSGLRGLRRQPASALAPRSARRRRLCRHSLGALSTPVDGIRPPSARAPVRSAYRQLGRRAARRLGSRRTGVTRRAASVGAASRVRRPPPRQARRASAPAGSRGRRRSAAQRCRLRAASAASPCDSRASAGSRRSPRPTRR